MSTAIEQQAEAIIDELLALPAVDRSSAAERACGGDAKLLDRVRSLLSALPMADGFLSDVTVDAAPLEAPVSERPGTMIGRYKLLQQIGEGGFGVVFMAEQQQPVRRRVALKVIKLGMDTREVVARFEAERQALAMMDHPNIAKVLDGGSTDTGRPYFVMELVRGSTITEYADKHKLSTRNRAALAMQVCRAVQHAHGKGIIHRDLKPSNVLVTVADDKPVPKVIDFGIAKATQSKLTDRTLFTAHRQLIGTPQYMSPEQADSDGVDVDTRTDVYSLGVLLYELLVGVTPFDAQALRSAAFDAMRKMIRDSDVPRPTNRLNTLAADSRTAIATSRSTDVKKLAESIHGELDWIVMRALEKDRGRRYDTAAAMADDLNRYLAGEAVLAGPVSGTYRLRKMLKRYKAAVAIGSAVAACLLLGVAGTTWGLVQARHQRAAAVANEQRAQAGEHEAQRQREVATTNERQARRGQAAARATLDFFTADVLAKAAQNGSVSKVLVESLITPALETVDQRFDDQPLTRAIIQQRLAATLLDLGRADLAGPPAKAAWDGYRRIEGDEAQDTLLYLNFYIEVIDAQGRHAEAAQLSKQLLDARRRVSGKDDVATIAALNNYATDIASQGNNVDAEPLLKQTWESLRRVRGDDHPDTMLALHNYALAIDGQGRHAEAAPLLKRLWEDRRRVQGTEHPDTITALTEYAGVLDMLGQHATAEMHIQEAIKLSRLLPFNAPQLGAAYAAYAQCLIAQQRWAQANDVANQAWKWDQAHSDPSDEAVPNGLQVLIRCVCHAGGIAGSSRILAYDLRHSTLDPDRLAVRLHALANGLKDAAQPLLAEPLYRDTITLLRQGKARAELTSAIFDYALCLQVDLQRSTDAQPLFTEALDRAKTDDPANLTMYTKWLDTCTKSVAAASTAEKQCKMRWDFDRQTLGDDARATLDALRDYAQAVESRGGYAEAGPLLKQVWDQRTRVSGKGDPHTIAAARRYAKNLTLQAKEDEAAAVLSQVIDTLRLVRPEDPLRSEILLEQGRNFTSEGKWVAAAPMLREALNVIRKQPNPDEPTLARTLYWLGRATSDSGQPAEAEPIFRELIDLDHHQRPIVRRYLADALEQLAATLQRLGPTRAAEANAALAEVVALRGGAAVPHGQERTATSEPASTEP